MRAFLTILLLIFCFTDKVKAGGFFNAKDIAHLRELSIVVYTYTPDRCEEKKLLILFAGYNRNSKDYLNRAKPVAERACLIALAPQFDRKRFPNWRYHRAGIFRKNKIQPPSKWTAPILTEFIKWARTKVGRPNAPYILFGHSAGGQFLSRLTAYSPMKDPMRIVIANPSVHVLPSMHEKVPYGFGDFVPAEKREKVLRSYLAQPITIYLGTDDRRKKLLLQNDEAVRQGKNRYERGLRVYREAESISQKKGWQFNWRLVEVAGVGHSSTRMLRAPQAEEAFGLSSRVYR